MLNKKQILEEVAKTIDSYDDDIILEENPFLLTRIKALQANLKHKRKNVFAFKIGFTQVLLLLILIINLITVVYNIDRKPKQNLQEKLVMELKSDFQLDQSQNNF